MYDEIKTDCMNRWEADDPMIHAFNNNFDEWMSQFPDDIKLIIRELLNHFEYYSKKRMNRDAKQYFDDLLKEIDFDKKNVVVSPVKFRIDYPDSSTMISYEFLLINGLTEVWCQTESQRDFQFKKAQVIIVVDDICGSGETFIEFLSDNHDLLRGKDVVYIVYHFMESTRSLIEESANNFGIHLHVICKNNFEKGFNLIAPVHSLQEDKRSFCEFSENVGISGDYILGFKDSEALVSFHHDTPNDTLGIFWYQHGSHKPIFPRKKYRQKNNTIQAMQKNKQYQKNMNYGAAMEINKLD